jgi:hypothetical protein
MAKEASKSAHAKSADEAKERYAAFAPGRVATIKTMDDQFDKDKRDEILNISQLEPGAELDTSFLEEMDEAERGKYSFENISGGPIIGMRRGGKYMAVDGFGFRDEADFVSRGSPVGRGATRLKDAGAR